MANHLIFSYLFRKTVYLIYSPIVLFILILIISLFPVKKAQATKPLILKSDQGSYKLGPYIEILEDQNREWTVDDVSTSPLSDNFKPIKTEVLNLGIKNAAIWIRFTLFEKSVQLKPENSEQNWMIEIGRGLIDKLTLYIPLVDENKIYRQHTFVNNFWKKIIVSNKGFTKRQIFLPRLPNSPLTFYFRVESAPALFLPLTIYSQKIYSVELKKRMLLHGIYYGTILAMFIFNLFVFFSLREHTHLYYLCYIFSTALFFLFFNEIPLFFIQSIRIELYRKINYILLGLTCFWSIFFSNAFLLTKKYSIIVDKAFRIVLVFTGALIFAIALKGFLPFLNYAVLTQIFSILGFIAPILILIASIVCWWRGFRPVLFFLCAWSIFTIGALIFAATYRGLLPYTLPTWFSFQMSSGLEVVILSFALVHRVRVLGRQQEKIKDIFGKYVTPEIRDEIMNGRLPLDGEVKKVTVLFSDLRNFTSLVETSPPKEVIKIINRYFSEMSEAIRQHHGLVLQFIGDEIEAVFGAPLPLESHQIHAVKSALEMRKRLNSVNDRLQKEGYGPLRHGIGIHTGSVVAANIGSPDRLSYALVGDTVNIASRIQELNKQYETDILISATTQLGLYDKFETKKLSIVKVRGKEELVEIYRLL
jgi:class 3 adenylate cyclase